MRDQRRITSHQMRKAVAQVVESLEQRVFLAGTPVDLGVVPGLHAGGMTLSTAGEEDVYRLELLRQDSVVFSVTSPGIANAQLQVRNSLNQVLGTAVLNGNTRSVSLLNLAAGTYTMHVSGGVAGSSIAYSIAADPHATSTTRVLYVNDGATTADAYTTAVGNDANTGLDAAHPKASVQAILDAYDVGPNDLVVIDTGTYEGGTVQITAPDEGAYYAGTAAGSAFGYGGVRFELTDADFNTFYGLRFTGGGGTGFYVHGDGASNSVSNTFRANRFDGTDTALEVIGGSDDRFIGNTVSGAGAYGIYLEPGSGSLTTVQGNTISGRGIAVYVAPTVLVVPQVAVQGNTLSQGRYGVFINGGESGIAVSGNTVSDYTDTGIYTASAVQVSGNTVTNSATGIYSGAAGTLIRGNSVSGNLIGIAGYGSVGGVDWSSGQPNHVFSNGTGIVAYADATVRFNRVYSNATGIVGKRNTSLHHNIIYRNTQRGILVSASEDVSIVNNTIYAPAGDGVRIEDSSSGVSLRNNIIWTQAGYDIYVATNSQQGFASDYNNLFASGTGKVAWFQKDFVDLFDWQVEADFDSHSIGYTALHPTRDNPLFVNAAGDDYHLSNLTSTSIDAGDPVFAYSEEGGSNGGRIDLGAYGNTPQAGQSRSSYLQLQYPTYYTDWEASDGHAILWNAWNVSGNVKLELHREGVGKVADIATVAASAGSYGWSPASSGITGDVAKRYWIQISSVSTPSLQDRSRESFAVPPSGQNYYVNDGSLTNNEYTTAAGSNRNTGKTAADPKANLLPMLRSYNLEPNDTVYIDTGDYIHVRNVVISGDAALGNDEGVRITGPTNPARIARIDRANTNAGSTAIEIAKGDYVTLSNLTIQGARMGLWVHQNSTNFSGGNLTAAYNSYDGITIESDSSASSVGRLVAHHNGRYGLYSTVSGLAVQNGLFYSNDTGLYVAGNATVSGNEVYANRLGIHIGSGTSTISGNSVYNNSGEGIYSDQTTGTISGNTVRDNGANGILVSWGTVTVSGNVAYRNYAAGIAVVAGNATVSGNRAYANAVGIDFNGGGTVKGNTVYSNTTGIEARGDRAMTVENNLVYANAAGLRIRYATASADAAVRVHSNTIYQITGDAVRVQESSRNVVLSNNILRVNAGYAISVADDSQVGFASDYNLFHLAGPGRLARWQGKDYAARATWFRGVGFDGHSLTGDPQFADVDGADNQMGYSGGVDRGADDNFHLLAGSPAVDAGDPGSYYLAEPTANGGRANLGHEGNTPQATPSAAQTVQMVTPNGDELYSLGQNVTVQWRSSGLTQQDAVALINVGDMGVVDGRSTGEGIWLADNYRQGGASAGSFSTAVNLAGVTNPAPEAVYQSYATGNSLAWALPVPDGSYTIRLHFVEYAYGAGQRRFNVKLQGTTVQSNYDIYTAAGGQFRATTLSYAVTATGGAGVNLELMNQVGGAIISGIELLKTNAGGAANPTAKLELYNGASWSTIATTAAMDRYGWGSRAWTATPTMANALMRVTGNSGTLPQDASNASFQVSAGRDYYVNVAGDTNFADNEYTTAAGDNGNIGKSPDQPMASLAALLAAYDLGEGDVIHVDTGTYLLAANIIVDAGDAGVRISGPRNHTALFDRGNTSEGSYAFDLQDADGVTLEYVSVTGADNGIHVAGGSTDVTIRNSVVYNCGGTAAIMVVGTDGVLVSDSEVYGNFYFGISGGPGLVVSGSRVHNNPQYGVYLNGGGAVIGSELYANASGVYAPSGATTIVGNTVRDNLGDGIGAHNGDATIANNTVYSNGGNGITYANGTGVISGNTVYGNVGSGIAALTSNSTIADNRISGNARGVDFFYSRGALRGNTVYGNAESGLLLRYLSEAVVEANRVYSNAAGIELQQNNTATVSNNLVYANTDAGLLLRDAAVYSDSFVLLQNNTVYQPAGDAVRAQETSQNIRLSNNILSVGTGYAVSVADDSQVGFASDYNLFNTAGAGTLGMWQGRNWTSRLDWFRELGFDGHSLTGDPQLADVDGADNQMGYSNGVDRGADDNFHLLAGSPAVDAGDPGSYYLAEPTANGGRANLGHEGNTPQATASAAQTTQVISPNGGELFTLGQGVNLQWRNSGLAQQDAVALIDAGGRGTTDARLTGQGIWLADRYGEGLWAGMVTEQVLTDGVTHPAPQSVYATYIQSGGTPGDKLRWSLPVPNGSYTVRLHFVEPIYWNPGQRLFDVRLQGATVQSGYDIFAAAGETNRATVLSFAAAATGGAGLSLELVNQVGGAIVSGIEVLRTNTGGAASLTARVETYDGAGWTTVAAAAPVDRYGWGNFAWSAGPMSGNALLRVTANQGTMPQDASDTSFQVSNSGSDYYISPTGSNSNSGKSPDKPMASLGALLGAYDLGAGDVVHAAAGTYSLFANTVISADDAGVTIAGPTVGAAIFDRGNTSAGSYAFELRNADGVTLKDLAITSAYHGVYVGGGSENVVIASSAIYNHGHTGIVADGADGVLVAGTEVYGNLGNGIRGGTGLVVSSSTIHHNQFYGIVLDHGGSVSKSTIYSNETGIFADGGTSTISSSVVRDNANDGIRAGAAITAISGNIVSGNARRGISVYTGTYTISGNRVHSNQDGIEVYYSDGVVRGNTVLNNSDAGIYLNYRAHVGVEGNRVYSNSIGIEIYASTPAVVNNLVYDNSNQALLLHEGQGRVQNNTIYQLVGEGIRMQGSSSNVTLSNNIIRVDAGYALYVADDSQVGFASDYNLFHTTGTGSLAWWQSQVFTDRADWSGRVGVDRHSRSADPQFADIDGANNELGYRGADFGADDNFHLLATSPGIDSGDPASNYMAEPWANGGRVNMGHEGNTPQATASGAQTIQVISANGSEKYDQGQSVTLQWHGSGLAQQEVLALLGTGLASPVDARGAGMGIWHAKAYQTAGSSGLLFSSAVDTAGMTNPAPQAVYQSGAFSDAAAGSKAAWLLPVADGSYTIRLHFAESSFWTAGQRVFDVKLQGVTVQSGYDIYAAAGTQFKATALSFPVTVTGGSGIDLQLVSQTGGALLNGIEIIRMNAAGAISPTAKVELYNGSTWSTLAAAAPMDRYGWGSLAWSAGPVTNSALLRVTANQGTLPQDASDSSFQVVPSGNNYYIAPSGSDSNTGKSPDQPMANLSALLAAYDLDAGDVINVAAGTYNVLANVVIGADDAGVKVRGPATGTARFDRGSVSTGSYVFELADADGVTLEALSISGGYDGVHVRGGSAGVTIRNSEISAHGRAGVYVAGTDEVLVTGSVVSQTGMYGVYGASGLTISGSRVQQSYYGVYFVNGGSALNNEVSLSQYGILAQNGSVLISGNTVHENAANGIHVANSTSTISDNIVYENAADGIVTYQANCTISGNRVYGNATGIILGAWSQGTVRANVAYDNRAAGIFVAANAAPLVESNRTYSNAIGLEAYGAGGLTAQNNLVYANSNQGILLRGVASARVLSNTVYQSVGDAIRLQESSNNVALANNILQIDAGYGLYVEQGSETGLASDYNLFWQSTDPNAHVGYIAGVTLDMLPNWQGGTSLDQHSTEANPNFVDINGADNVLGYSTAGNGYNGGGDDNFHVRRYSPAIDRGDAWMSPMTDLEGLPRRDDAGVANAGRAYVQTSVGANQFALVGTAQNWRSNNAYWTLDLPFAFSFFGANYTQVLVSPLGFLQFGGTDGIVDASNSTGELAAARRIAVLWDDLRTDGTDDDIFVDTSAAGQVTIRWNATNNANSSDTNFSVTLYDDGRIRTHYGAGNTGLTPTAGISPGNGAAYILSTYDGMATLTNAVSRQFAAGIGFTDIGAYEFQTSSTDSTAPRITGSTPVGIDLGTVVNTPASPLVLTFSEAVDSVDAWASANYELRGVGADGTFGTADDVLIAVTPAYTPGSTQVSLAVAGGVLPLGQYRLTIFGSAGRGIHDLAGWALDGDGNGTEGGNYLRAFSVVQPPPAPAITGIINDTGSSTTDGVTNDNTLVIRGTATAGVLISVYRNDAPIGTTTADGSGAWAFDYTSTALADGQYTFTAVAVGATGGVSGLSAPFAVKVDRMAPAVTSWQVNLGASQRSMVRRVDVAFSEPVVVSTGALQVKLQNGTLPANTVTSVTNPSGDQRNYVLTFSGSAVIGGSLADGIYDLVATAAAVQDLAGNAMTANYSQRFHRLFGDNNGDRRVNLVDYRSLRTTLGRSSGNGLFNSAFDFDNNGVVNVTDLTKFRRKFGARYTY